MRKISQQKSLNPEFQVSLFLLHILSVPGLIEHLNKITPDVLTGLLLQKQTHILAKSVKFLSQEQQLKIHFNALEGSYALCLTANLVHLVFFFWEIHLVLETLV